jgi:hypothetical protein
MDNFDMFSNWNKMFDNINKLSNPLGNNLDWITKLNSINTSGLAAIEFTKAFHNNSLHQNLMYNDIAKSLDFISDNSIKSVIDNIYNNNGIDVYKDVLNKIHSTNYWGNLTKLVILDELNSASNEDELENVMSNISDNIDTINLSLEDIDKDPIAFFNNICLSIKSYMDNNPSVKYSSYFIFWLISTIIIPILLSKAESSEENKSGEIQISNNYNITNNYYSNSTIAKINTKFVSLKNYPRDKSKTVHFFKKNDKVRVLKDSLKWALVIKENSIESGWIRKEFLNFTEN